MILVFTNGVFDLLHAGHVRLLEFARSHGDRLVVGVNSDASVRRIKGPDRPIIPVEERVEILRSLRCVDKVRIFDEDTPVPLIRRLRPDVLVKGPACKGAAIPGAQLVESWGGDTPQVMVSAKTGEGISDVLDMILLVAEMKELTAAEQGPARGVVLEAQKEKGRGIVATVLVRMKRHQESPATPAGRASPGPRPLRGRGDGLNSYGPEDDPC